MQGLTAKRSAGGVGTELRPKGRFEAKMEGYRRDLEDLSYEARMDPDALAAYAEEIFPRTPAHKDLWSRFRTMSGGDVKKAYREAFSLFGSYTDLVKNAIAGGEQVKDDEKFFLAYAVGMTERWVEHAASEGRGGRLTPGWSSPNCPDCGGALEYTRDAKVRCPRCDSHYSWSCSACGSGMRLNPGSQLLECGKCGYSVAFTRKLLPPLDDENVGRAYMAYALHGVRDPRLEHCSVVVTEELPSGRVEVFRSPSTRWLDSYVRTLVDDDDGQTEGSLGRIIRIVYSDGKNLNAWLLIAGNANIFVRFCSASEFSSEDWANKGGTAGTRYNFVA